MRSRVVGQLAWLITKIYAGSTPASAIKYVVAVKNLENLVPQQSTIYNPISNHSNPFVFYCVDKPLLINRSGL